MKRRDPDRIPCRWCGHTYDNHNHGHPRGPNPGAWCWVNPAWEYEPHPDYEEETA